MSAFVKTSKFLSLVLRHAPDKVGLKLDSAGWANIDELIRKVTKAGHPLTREVLGQIVAENDKQRFAISEDGKRIRASQGHSIQVDLGLTPSTPPDVLFHGTAMKNRGSIIHKGILKGSRQHVHLSVDVHTAMKVGMRHGAPLVFAIDAKRMFEERHIFFVSENKVWLTEHVPPEFLLLGYNAENVEK